MTRKEIESLITACSVIAFDVVYTNKKPKNNIRIKPSMMHGVTHVNLKDRTIYISALQFDHFVNVITKMSDAAGLDDIKKAVMIFMIAHELFHIRHSDKNLEESEINNMVFKSMRISGLFDNHIIKLLRQVF